MPYKNIEDKREYHKQKSKEWRLANPRKRFATVLRHRYKITLNDYDKMVTNQSGRCKICGNNPETLHIDHCHETGQVRGLLCFNCNNGLGAFKDCVNTLQNALIYLRKANGE
jgi:hypothetical protein